MSLRDKLLVSVFSAVQIFAGVYHAAAQQTPFDRLIEKFREGQVFEAAFDHEYIDSYTQDTVVTVGTIWVAESSYKVHNNRQTMVVDGETSRVYDANRNRVIISTYEPEESDFAPSRFLNGTDSTYTVAGQRKRGETTVVELTTDDPFAVFKKVEITLASDLIPLNIFAVDQTENLITTRFSSGTFIKPREGLFVLEVPEEAEIIDMRN